MKTEIVIKLSDKKLTIQEAKCEMVEYQIKNMWPGVVDEICNDLHDYLEGLG